MSAPIRPLPVEAAPQRTESDATFSSQPDPGTPGFGEVLNLHLATSKDGKSGEDSDPNDTTDSHPQPAKNQKEDDSSAWNILGVAYVPPPIIPAVKVEFGQSSPQLANASDSIVADKNGSAPSSTAQAVAPQTEKNSPEIAAALQQLTPVPEVQNVTAELLAKPEEIAAKPPETGQKLRGIPVAKQSSMPLTPEKKDLSSSQEPRSILSSARSESPSAAAALESASTVLRPITASPKAPVQPIQFALDKFAAQQDSFAPAIRVEAPSAPVQSSQATDVRAAAVIDSIRDHVQIVRISQQNELNVVLRPDAHTELSLQIRHVDGQIHLQARCERGDFTWLDSNWSAVQNTLGQQGVRVEPLQAAYRAQDGSSSLFMQDQRGSQQQAQRGTAPEFTFEQETGKPRNNSLRPSSSVAPVRGWQSWA